MAILLNRLLLYTCFLQVAYTVTLFSGDCGWNARSGADDVAETSTRELR